MDTITLKPCCALCDNLWNKNKCPLHEVYESASNYGNDSFDYNAKYVVRCDDFLLNTRYKVWEK